MKIQYYSDLHMEFGKFTITDPSGDVLVLAGDIDVGLGARPFIEKYCQMFKAVIYVAGNHEFYNQFYVQTLKRFRGLAYQIDNFYFLENDTVVIDGVQFAGCTLWTNLRARPPEERALIEYRMNDYRIIYWDKNLTYGGYSKRKASMFTIEKSTELHLASMDFLHNVNYDIPTVVVTHHAPHEVFIDKARYGKDDLNHAYYTDCRGLFDRVPVWIAGHTHKSVEVQIDNCLLLSNSRGYVGYAENPQFHQNKAFYIDY